MAYSCGNCGRGTPLTRDHLIGGDNLPLSWVANLGWEERPAWGACPTCGGEPCPPIERPICEGAETVLVGYPEWVELSCPGCGGFSLRPNGGVLGPREVDTLLGELAAHFRGVDHSCDGLGCHPFEVAQKWGFSAPRFD